MDSPALSIRTPACRRLFGLYVDRGVRGDFNLMITPEHQKHIDSRTVHMRCPECRADCERRFLPARKWRYKYVSDYLAYVKPRLAAIHIDTPESRRWLRGFRLALDRRISLKAHTPQGRKYNDAFLERLKGLSGFGLSRFELFRKASCLDY